MPMNESTRHNDLLKAFAEPKCPICAMVLRDLKQDLDILLLERINKVPTHEAFRAGRGLCNAHAHQLTKARGGAPAIAVMYESTMVEFMKDLAKVKASGGGLNRFIGKKSLGVIASNQLEPTGACLICDIMNKNEASYVNIVAENVQDAQLMEAFEKSVGGVCLPHGRMVMAECSQADDLQAFMSLQVPKWQDLHADLKLYIKHNDENVPQHKMGKEGDSWSRSIRYLSGEDNVFGYRR